MKMNTDGILLIDKPQGYTSFDVVARMRGMLSTRKVGHAGTLDPMATGVLPVFVGRATKCCDILPRQDKRYLAEFVLGKTTDTQDITGTVLTESAVDVNEKDVEKVLESFRGKIQQIPPMYSAVQVDGKRLYELARKGVEVERKPRDIEIFSLELIESDAENARYVIDVHCSKGTYIRTVCHDIGQELGCGATLTGLRRTMAAGFGIGECITIDEANELAEKNCLREKLIPISEAFRSLAEINLSEDQTRMFRNGVRLDAKRCRVQKNSQENRYRVLGADRTFLGIAHIGEDGHTLYCDKLFATEGNP